MTIPRILRRLFPGITLLLIVVVAYLQARGIVQLLGLALGGSCDRVSSLPPPPPPPPPLPHDTSPPVPTAPSFMGLPEPMRPFGGSAAAPAPIGAPPLAQVGSVRIVPEQVAGKVVGLRLFGVRPSSLLGTLGLKNGDRLDSINGFEVGNPEKALEAYARLRNASRLQLRLDRAGKPVQIDLNII